MFDLSVLKAIKRLLIVKDKNHCGVRLKDMSEEELSNNRHYYLFISILNMKVLNFTYQRLTS